MPLSVHPDKVWTFEDLQELPDDIDWRRFEIVDGALVVSPSADFDHEIVLEELRAALRPQVPSHLRFGGPLTVDLDPTFRIPDLIVFPRNLAGRGLTRATPGDVELAVEVVSPGSRTTDRITKPAEYAAAGIPAYWRIERDPRITLTAYVLELGACVYTELGVWGPGQVAEINRPFPVRIDIDQLVPANDD